MPRHRPAKTTPPSPAYPQPTPDHILTLQERIGITFQQPDLLLQAVTHRSYYNENKWRQAGLKNNERLEFLGDAILEFISGDWLFHQFPKMFEGKLTLLRMQLVRTEALASYSLACGLDQFLRIGNGDEAQGARYSQRILGNAFEALLGAIYLDQGIATTREFALSYLEPMLERVLQEVSTKDPKSRFQEWSQAQDVNITPTYHTLQAAEANEDKLFVVEVRLGEEAVGWGSGSNLRTATHNAALFALQNLAGEEAVASIGD